MGVQHRGIVPAHGDSGGANHPLATSVEHALRLTEQRLTLQYAVTAVLASASLLSDAMPQLLETIGTHLGWDVGVYWTMDDAETALHCYALWRRHAPTLDQFTTLSQQITFLPGIGLPGRVWVNRQPIMIPDVTHDPNFPRVAMATLDGVHGAIGFPIQTGAKLHGVMEFFSQGIGELDADLVQALMALGTQIGLFIGRVQIDAARRETDVRRAAMLETALDAIVTMDHAGRIVEFNPAAEHVFGYSRAEALGQELAALIIPPGQRGAHRAGLAAYLATGKGPLLGRRLDVRAWRKDGSSFPAEVAITQVPVGGPPLFTGYIRDITERTGAETALRESRETFRLLFASNPQPMWVYDLETLAFLEVNDAAIAQYGYTRDAFLAMRITDIRPAEDVARVIEDVRQPRPALQGSGEWRHRRRDGSLLDVDLTSHTLTFAGRAAVLVSARDITAQKKAAAALRASEERLRTVVTNAPIVLFAVDRDGIFTLSDGKGLESLGLRPNQHVGQSYFALYSHLPDSAAALRRALAGEAATTVNEYKGLVFETRWMPTIDDSGTVIGAIGVSADITARTLADEERASLHERERAARAEAQERAAQLEAMFEAMEDAVLVFDRTGQILHANAALHHLMDLTGHQDLMAHSLDERGALSAPYDEHGHPLSREQWPSVRILRGEVLTSAQAADVTISTRAGGAVQLNISGSPVRDRDGRVMGGILVMREVTERRRLERRTREALEALLAMAHALVSWEPAAVSTATEHEDETRLVGQRLVELTRDVLGCRRVSISALDTRTGLMHPVAVVGLSTEEEATWRATAAPARLDAADSELVARLLMGEVVLIDMAQPPFRDQPNPYDARIILATLLRVGENVVGALALDYGSVEHTYTPDEVALAGAVAKLAALVIDRDRLLREREEARANETALREANRRMDEFLGIAGHEMRTPLTTISGLIQLAHLRAARLAASDDLPAIDRTRALVAIQQVLDRADAGLTRLNGLVSDLLDVSRIHAGHLEIRPEPTDLANLVGRVVDEYRELDATSRISLQINSREPVTVIADAERIGQVLTNYLSNALKYSSPDQPVSVGLNVDGPDARVWVRDAGPGVPLAEQERIWDRFYRVAGTAPQHGSSVGLGLGLHISRGIIERHGGHVGVESGSGVGAIFWFTIPLAHID